jgi:hypothetical protein
MRPKTKPKTKWQEKVWIKNSSSFVTSGILSMPSNRAHFGHGMCQWIVNYTLTIRVTIPLHFRNRMNVGCCCYTHFLRFPILSTNHAKSIHSSTLKKSESVCCPILVNVWQLHVLSLTKHCPPSFGKFWLLSKDFSS